jgi:hypothetical protein
MLSEYLIDRHRVVFDTGIGWHCVCAEFVATKDCRHIRESVGRLAAQDRIRNRAKPEFGTLTPFDNRSHTDESPLQAIDYRVR